MLGALIIVFREVIEAGIIVGIVLAVTRAIPGRGRWISIGVAGGIGGALLIAAFAETIANALSGMGQEIFNAGILLLAVAMLAWHNIWMARHGRELAAEMKDVGLAVAQGTRSLMALAVVVGVAVLREGSEIVLFLYGIIIAGGTTAVDILLGSAIGLALGCVLSALTFFGLVRIPARYLFGVMTVLITFLAAGLAAQSVVFLQQAGLLTALTETMWDSSSFLSDTSIVGRVLHTLVGYSDQPSAMQVLVYGVTLVAIFALTWMFSPARRASAAKAA